jgi:hypothetical protein
MMMNEVTIDFNVLGALMKNIIMSNVNSTMIIAVNRSTGGLGSTHVSQEPTKLEEFWGGISESTVLSFSTGTSNNGLFLAMPRDKRGTQ